MAKTKRIPWPRADECIYGERIKGDSSNWNWDARFDWQSGHLGITQFDSEDKNLVRDRVLLSHKQVAALVDFLKQFTSSDEVKP